MLPRPTLSTILAMLAGCTAPPPRHAQPPPVTAVPVAHPPDPCLGQPEEIIFTVTPEVDASCSDGDFRTCVAQLPLAVQNCRPATAILERIELSHEGVLGMRLDFGDRHLAHGERLEHSVRLSAGRYHITATVRDDEASEPRPMAALQAQVTNTALDDAQRACRECHGEWGAMGMLGRLGCNCRLADAGKECRDGDQCEGLCRYHHTEIVQKPEPVHCSSGRCTAQLGLGVDVGRCSERRSVFGCVSLIPKGASREPPHLLPARANHVCID